MYVTEYPDGFKLQVRYRDALWEKPTIEAFAIQLEQRLLDLGFCFRYPFCEQAIDELLAANALVP